MPKTSLTSEHKPSKGQIRQARTLTTEAVEETLDEEGTFTGEELQAIHANGGVYKQEFATIFRVFVLNFARKALAITPVRAQDTGLIPLREGYWKVLKDDLEGEINPANLDYFSCPVLQGESYVDGITMLRRSMGAYGSLGFAAALLKLQGKGKEIFPRESRGKHHFLMPLTILGDSYGSRCLACFFWRDGHWALEFRSVSRKDLFGVEARFVRPRN